MMLLLITSFLFIKTINSIVILFILADDLGWGDVNFTNPTSNILTPTINQLATNGIILSNYYVQPICSPTRSALMSSKYPIYTGFQSSVILDSVPYGLPFFDELNNSIIILPKYLKNNYNIETHMIGKWHIGFYKKEYTPEQRGFDTFYGYYTGNEEYWNHTSPCWSCGNYTALDLGFHNNTHDIYDNTKSGIYSTELFTTKVEQIINNYYDNGSDKDLFIYIPYEAVHGAANCNPDCDDPDGDLLQVPQYFIDQQSQIENMNRRTYAGMLGALDSGIKNITDLLKTKGLWNDTILIFSSDNGAPASHFNSTAMTNYPLRGQKSSLWEGGVRVPAFIYSNLLNKTGFNYTELMHITDWYPTIVNMINDLKNININVNLTNIDGINQWNSIKNNIKSKRTEILINIDPTKNYSAIISDGWKLLQGMSPGEWYPMTTENENKIYLNDIKNNNNLYLYKIKDDPYEYNNIANENMNIVKQLQNKIKQYSINMIKPFNNTPDPNAQQLILNAGYWCSWQDGV